MARAKETDEFLNTGAEDQKQPKEHTTIFAAMKARVKAQQEVKRARNVERDKAALKAASK